MFQPLSYKHWWKLLFNFFFWNTINYWLVWFYVRFLYDNLALTTQRNTLNIKTDHWTTKAFAHAHAQEKNEPVSASLSRICTALKVRRTEIITVLLYFFHFFVNKNLISLTSLRLSVCSLYNGKDSWAVLSKEKQTFTVFMPVTECKDIPMATCYSNQTPCPPGWRQCPYPCSTLSMTCCCDMTR